MATSLTTNQRNGRAPSQATTAKRTKRWAVAVPAVAVAGVGLSLLAPAAASAAPNSTDEITIRSVTVGSPGNSSVAIVPFTDAIYTSCSETTATDCMNVGGVNYRYGIGEIEVTVGQWVKFLNVADPNGTNAHRLYSKDESSTNWPKYGQINYTSTARSGKHYTVSYPQWEDKPYVFANFLRAARFANSMQNGKVVARKTTESNGIKYVTYRVSLSPETERGMYNLARNKRTGAKRARVRGFVIPSQNEWMKAAYFDPKGGGTYSYWKYPTNAGVFGDNTATAPASTLLNAGTGEVTNSATQPLANYHASDIEAPTWCPNQIRPARRCSTVNPLGKSPFLYQKLFQGNVSTVGQALTRSPWGTLDQGGNAVEWTDTITAPPKGKTGGRVWRRLHGGVANAPAYQLWLSAVGLQPQDNKFYEEAYPWLGFRMGVIGEP